MKKKTVMSPMSAFVASVISLLVCVLMFTGTTFAWFTDSISSNTNKIMAGTLNVALEYYDVDRNAWVKVDNTTSLLDDSAEWNPGHTEIIYLRVVNRGSLALKYQLGVSVHSENTGINLLGEELKLSEHIMFGVAATQVPAGSTFEFIKYNETDADRLAARVSVADTAKKIGVGFFTDAAKLTQAGDVDYLTLVIYIPEEAGDAAIAAAGEDASIKLSIDLMATQANSEAGNENEP